MAAIVCVIATFTAFRFSDQGSETRGLARVTWTGFTGLATGAGVWATHFIAMLGFRPGLDTGYLPQGTFVSFGLIVVAATCGFAIRSKTAAVSRSLLGAAILAVGIAAMHYTGMGAFRTQGVLLWNTSLIIASLVFCGLFTAAALLWRQGARGLKHDVVRALFLTTAICTLHFTAMGAVTVLPDSTVAVPSHALAPGTMAPIVAVLVSVLVLSGLALSIIDRSNLVTLKQREHSFRLLFEQNPVAMWLLEPDSLQFLDVNLAATRQYGWSNDQFRAMTVFDVLPADEQDALRELLALRQGSSGYSGDRIWRHRTESDSELFVQPFAELIEEDRGPVLLTALFDVTARVQSEATLQETARSLEFARNEAQAANVAKSEFLANMSHEIRTPLNGVLGLADALSRTRLDLQQRQILDLITTSGTALTAILSDVLDLAKVESGQLHLAEEPFGLRETLSSAAFLFEAVARDKGLGFTVQFHLAGPDRVVGDPLRVRQVVSNLISNAVKFTSTGAVAIRASGVAGADGGLELRVSVSDTGPGFTEDVRSKLFRRFEQGDNSVTRKYGGTGLGLSIAIALAEMMGGEISCRAVPGQGATFVFKARFPSAEGRESAPMAAAHPQETLARPPRILLAEDHEVNQKVIQVMLAETAELVIVADGQQAVEAVFGAEPFDLVLMDTQMPVMDGLTAIRRIRERERAEGLPKVPIISVTANAMPHQLAACLDAGADLHLTKPVTMDGLFAALGKALYLPAEESDAVAVKSTAVS